MSLTNAFVHIVLAAPYFSRNDDKSCHVMARMDGFLLFDVLKKTLKRGVRNQSKAA